MRQSLLGMDRSHSLVGYFLIGLVIVSAVSGQLLFKSGVDQMGGFTIGDRVVSQGIRLLTTWQIVAGLAFYSLGWLMWMAVLSRFPLSFAYPFTTLNYVFITLFSWVALKETISPLQAIGIAVICTGLFILSRG